MQIKKVLPAFIGICFSTLITLPVVAFAEIDTSPEESIALIDSLYYLCKKIDPVKAKIGMDLIEEQANSTPEFSLAKIRGSEKYKKSYQDLLEFYVDMSNEYAKEMMANLPNACSEFGF